MKKLAVVLATAVAMAMAAPASAQAQDRPDGFGIGLGQGTGVSGISGKVHTGGNALQGVIGSWRGRTGALGFSGDYLWNMDLLADEGVVQIGWNLGVGATIGISAPRYRYSFGAHAQGVAGLEFLFPDVPLDVVFEFRPSVRILPVDRAFHWVGWDVPWAGGHIRIYLD